MRTHRLSLAILGVTLLMGVAVLRSSAQGTAPATPAAKNPPPGGPSPSVVQPWKAGDLPAIYVGYVTKDEFQRICAYEDSIRADPEVAQLNKQVQALSAELQLLQAKLEGARKRVLKDNPAMDAIADKMRTAILAHLAANPMPRPAPSGEQSKVGIKAPPAASPASP